MTFAFIQTLEKQGVSFRLEGDQVKVIAPAHVMTPQLQAKLSRCKPFLAGWLKPKPESIDWRERCDERVAIRHHDSNLPLPEAEYLARREVLHDYLAACYPVLLAEYEAAITQPVRH